MRCMRGFSIIGQNCCGDGSPVLTDFGFHALQLQTEVGGLYTVDVEQAVFVCVCFQTGDSRQEQSVDEMFFAGAID